MYDSTDKLQEEIIDKTKPFTIQKWQVASAFKLVKANAGSAGVDQQTLLDFERNLKDNLYKLWNRLSSGSYFPPPRKSGSHTEENGWRASIGNTNGE